MKPLLRTTLIHGLAFSFLAMSGCKEAEIDTLSNEAQDGIWVVTEYIDSGQDETSDFDGYTFDFRDDSTVEAIDPNGDDHPGTWSVTESGSDDDGENDIHFNITFVTADEYLEEITDDWDVVSHTADQIELLDDDDENDLEVDYLTLRKQ